MINIGPLRIQCRKPLGDRTTGTGDTIFFRGQLPAAGPSALSRVVVGVKS